MQITVLAETFILAVLSVLVMDLVQSCVDKMKTEVPYATKYNICTIIKDTKTAEKCHDRIM